MANIESPLQLGNVQDIIYGNGPRRHSVAGAVIGAAAGVLGAQFTRRMIRKQAAQREVEQNRPYAPVAPNPNATRRHGPMSGH